MLRVLEEEMGKLRGGITWIQLLWEPFMGYICSALSVFCIAPQLMLSFYCAGFLNFEGNEEWEVEA